jgi:hypothetical protein
MTIYCPILFLVNIITNLMKKEKIMKMLRMFLLGVLVCNTLLISNIKCGSDHLYKKYLEEGIISKYISKRIKESINKAHEHSNDNIAIYHIFLKNIKNSDYMIPHLQKKYKDFWNDKRKEYGLIDVTSVERFMKSTFKKVDFIFDEAIKIAKTIQLTNSVPDFSNIFKSIDKKLSDITTIIRKTLEQKKIKKSEEIQEYDEEVKRSRSNQRRNREIQKYQNN